jgi:hypothetical protein
VLKRYSLTFSKLLVSLFDLEMYFYLPESEADEVVSDSDMQGMQGQIRLSRALSAELKLDAVPMLLERMEKRIEGKRYSKRDAGRDLRDLRSRIEDQLSQRFFFFVQPSLADYYQVAQQFGSDVEIRFPGAIDDIEGAAKCLALGQGTACVLHLMRVVEVGLKAIAKSLGIPYAPSWESYLNQIQSKISLPRKKKTAKWKKAEAFYRDVSGDLVTIKQAFRNPTMHVVRKYSADEAEEVFRAVRTFMKRLADGFKEQRSTS